MQTFLPYEDFKLTAKVLDKKRLFKQLVESYQIFNTITGKSNGWKNHPIVKMWDNYPGKLVEYFNEIYKECENRGFKLKKMVDHHKKINSLSFKNEKPWWLGIEKLHSSHRSNLLRKDFVYYSQFGWKEDTEQEYEWFKTRI